MSKEQPSLSSLIKALVTHRTVLVALMPSLTLITLFYFKFNKAFEVTPLQVDEQGKTIELLSKDLTKVIKVLNKHVIEDQIYRGRVEFILESKKLISAGTLTQKIDPESVQAELNLEKNKSKLVSSSSEDIPKPPVPPASPKQPLPPKSFWRSIMPWTWGEE